MSLKNPHIVMSLKNSHIVMSLTNGILNYYHACGMIKRKCVDKDFKMSAPIPAPKCGRMLLAREYQYKERNKISSPELFIMKGNIL